MSLAKAENKIKIAWVAGLLHTLLTLFVTISLTISYRDSNSGIFLYAEDRRLLLAYVVASFDYILKFSLVFGIYKKSRVAAVIMFSYLLLAQLILSITHRARPGILFFVLGACFFRGIEGTFEYHAIVRSQEHNDST